MIVLRKVGKVLRFRYCLSRNRQKQQPLVFGVEASNLLEDQILIYSSNS